MLEICWGEIRSRRDGGKRLAEVDRESVVEIQVTAAAEAVPLVSYRELKCAAVLSKATRDLRLQRPDPSAAETHVAPLKPALTNAALVGCSFGRCCSCTCGDR